MALIAPKRSVIIGGAVAAVAVLYVLGSEQQSAEGSQGAEPAAATQCRVTVTVDGLRVREAPTLDARIVGRFDRGQESDADKLVQNGFRRIGENRWVSTEFAVPVPGRDCG